MHQKFRQTVHLWETEAWTEPMTWWNSLTQAPPQHHVIGQARTHQRCLGCIRRGERRRSGSEHWISPNPLERNRRRRRGRGCSRRGPAREELPLSRESAAAWGELSPSGGEHRRPRRAPLSGRAQEHCKGAKMEDGDFLTTTASYIKTPSPHNYDVI